MPFKNPLRFQEMPNSPLSKVQFHAIHGPFTLRQRKALKTYLLRLLKRKGRKLDSLRFIFCSDAYLLGINQQFLQHDDYTDIITFDLSEKGGDLVGEIYISIDRIRENASSFGVSFQRELHRVIFHGVLHLCGYKDKTPKDKLEMNRQEDLALKGYFN